jgi:hypothetical protein
MKKHVSQPGEPPPARNAAAAQIDAVMDIGVFQLLPRGRATTDREVVEQALWEVDFADRSGFESVWVTEHHFSGYGSIGVPSARPVRSASSSCFGRNRPEGGRHLQTASSKQRH